MSPSKSERESWTLKSVLQAAGLAIAGMMITLQLQTWNLWPDIEWSFLVVPAVVGSGFLVIRHPGTGLVTALLFFPVLLFVMFYVGACLPLQPTP